jgi:hypothetical protein
MRHALFCHFETLNKELRIQILALPVSPQWTRIFPDARSARISARRISRRKGGHEAGMTYCPARYLAKPI